MMYLRSISTFLILLVSVSNIVDAQQQEQQPSPTTSVCSCAPTNFIFRLDFTRTCDDNTVPIGKTYGIDRSFCRTDGVDSIGGDDAQALAVVKLTSVLILELDKGLKVIKQHFRDGLELEGGDTLEYASIVADDDRADDTTVAAIQMALTGISTQGTAIQSQFILTYTNNCGTPDVFRIGDAISWLVVDEVVPAPHNLCNAGALPKQATSASSSNDIPPDLVDADDISGGGVDSDQAGSHANEPSLLSMQVLRRLDWQNMLLDEYSNLEAMAQRKSAAQFKGGLDRRLRRRRRILSR